MLFKRSLHFRIFISYAIFGAVIGVVLFLFLYLSYNLLEERLIAEHVDDEMQFFIELVRKNPAVSTLRTKKLHGVHLTENEQSKEFPILTGLIPGIHELSYADRNYIVKTTHMDDDRYHIMYIVFGEKSGHIV